jgi:hypothetical protein
MQMQLLQAQDAGEDVPPINMEGGPTPQQVLEELNQLLALMGGDPGQDPPGAGGQDDDEPGGGGGGGGPPSWLEQLD